MTKNLESNVGYGRPPRHSRFRPGESGNPAGRPKGAKNFAAELRAELASLMPGKAGDPLTKQRAIINRLVAGAIAGDAKAQCDDCLALFAERNRRRRTPLQTPIAKYPRVLARAIPRRTTPLRTKEVRL